MLAMRYDWRGNSLVIIHNFDDKPHVARIKPGVKDGDTLVNLLVKDESKADGKGFHRIALEAYGYRWYRVGNLSYALHRSRS